MPASTIKDDIDAYRAWDSQTRPILERLGNTLDRLPSETKSRAVAKALMNLREEIVAARNALSHRMDDRLEVVNRFERHILALELRIAALESDLDEWRTEYEPDADPSRPAFFSNIRRAVSVFFHSGR
jgi:hypothetical protein